VPEIFDNIEQKLLPALKHTLEQSTRADFCVGYFNLRGWRQIDSEIEKYSGGERSCCRLLVGMHRPPRDEVHNAIALGTGNPEIDRGQATRFKRKMAEDFHRQLTLGAPTEADQLGLQRLKHQLLDRKLIVKLYTRNTLHAKLYLVHRTDTQYPLMGYLGSSNLTFAGLGYQEELNIDVIDKDATRKLNRWFEERWRDRFCVDITQELIDIIEASWATEKLIPPYYVYLKMAYHLSQEARDGLSLYRAPSSFGLLKFQEAAVQIGAHLVNKRGGVMIGDVVGLGKTLVGTAIAHVCEEDFGISTLIICPKNLVQMWQSYVDNYGLRGKVMSISRVEKDLEKVPARFRLVMIDESHNLRNREGKRYAKIREYIEQSDSRCILLTATPYNKTYLDLSAQLRLFLPEDQTLGIKPEELIRNLGSEMEFRRRHPHTNVRSLAAFEKSEYSEDWQQLMSRYMIRRTRSFIKNLYAKQDEASDRRYLEFPDGSRSYFPMRRPKSLKFAIGSLATDPYARLYSDSVVQVINDLRLPRYGLGNYEALRPRQAATEDENKKLEALSRAGRRLMGFCRTNLFKRLESSGAAFIQSLERHILRNYVYLHAIENDLEIPIGTQDAEFLDTSNSDEDADSLMALALDLEEQEDDNPEDEELEEVSQIDQQAAAYKARAAEIYQTYVTQYRSRFKWLRASLFRKALKDDLRKDARSLIGILQQSGAWHADQDQKLAALLALLNKDYPHEKILIFTQFADTARYLSEALEPQVQGLAAVTGSSSNPTDLAWRFSPNSNKKRDQIPPDRELRVLVATDVLSEGQNLQDCRIIVNYDLPWAIIRLIQRAGRVDRIGQKAEEILCYSFMPAEGVERLINLRGRLRDRLEENAEVVGTDEAFFEDEQQRQMLLDLYNERSGIYDEEEDGEVDLTSEALSIWQSAIDANPKLKHLIEQLPNVTFATRHHEPDGRDPEGVLVYMRTPDGTDALAWVDKDGNSVTQSQMRILRMARCNIDTEAQPRNSHHHDLVRRGSEIILEQEKSIGGQLGNRRSAKRRTYERLDSYIQMMEREQPLLASGPDWESLKKAFEELYQYPLRQTAIAKLNKELRAGINDEDLARLVVFLRDNDAFCIVEPDETPRDAQIICSMGLFQENGS
jgi:superfamily II DNA or RNA helicase